MTDKFWVGGTQTWNGTAGTKWSLTSGGASGAAIPSATDNAIFDANSGGGTVTIGAASQTCLNFSNDGTLGTGAFTGSFAGTGTLAIAASLYDNGTLVGATGTITFTATSTGQVLKSSGNFFTGGNPLVFNGAGGGWTLQNKIGANGAPTGAITLTNGTFNDGGFSNYSTSIALGSGTKELIHDGVWTLQSGSALNFNSNATGFTYSPTTNALFDALGTGGTINFGSITYNDFRFSNSGGTNTLGTSAQAPTFRKWLFTTGGAHTVNIPVNVTVTFTIPQKWNGTAGNLITLQSNVATNTWNISCPAGMFECDYLFLRDSHAAGGAVFYAGANSTNSGANNTGWIFTAPAAAILVTAAKVTPPQERQPPRQVESKIEFPAQYDVTPTPTPTWAAGLVTAGEPQQRGYAPRCGTVIPTSAPTDPVWAAAIVEGLMARQPPIKPENWVTPALEVDVQATWAAFLTGGLQIPPAPVAPHSSVTPALEVDVQATWAAFLTGTARPQIPPAAPNSDVFSDSGDAASDPVWAAFLSRNRPPPRVSYVRGTGAYPALTPLTLGGIKVWDGAAWQARRIKVWDGGSWVEKPLRYWNGSAWVITPY